VTFSAEAAPYVKVGGLADVVGALPRTLEKLGARVALVLPAYKSVPFGKYGVQPVASLSAFEVKMDDRRVRAKVHQTRMPGTGIDVFFVGGGDYFSRDGVYIDPATKEDYPDNMQRFIFLMKAGLELLRKRGSVPDVIHCHDSHTALIPGLLATVHRQDPFFSRTGSMLTIHNLAYQGIFPKEALIYAGIGLDHFHPGSSFEYWGKVNFMKVGIETADLLTTVSETYAREIQTDHEYGFGLEGVLKRRSAALTGIVNGIDYTEWNPEKDPFIPAHYSAQDLSGKARCKAALLEAFGLQLPADRVPLIGIVSRLTNQKGFDLIDEAIEEIARLDLQMVVLGTGQQKYHDMLQEICSRCSDKIAVRFGFDNPLAHLIEAGADMFLMPSKFEPCGLNQLYSLRYGTIPIVRATGGLADTVINYDIPNDLGTGFSFRQYSAADMVLALKRALMVYSDPISWEELMRRCMAEDWSWERSARRYLDLYERIHARKRS
jgi:starch synthase